MYDTHIQKKYESSITLLESEKTRNIRLTDANTLLQSIAGDREIEIDKLPFKDQYKMQNKEKVWVCNENLHILKILVETISNELIYPDNE